MRDDLVGWLYGLQSLGVKLGLDAVNELLARIGRPDRAYPSILVGGTNGKGSVAAMLDAILDASGLATGFFSSPHLVRPNERIRIRGRDISDDDLTRLLVEVRSICARGVADGGFSAHPSFFEVMTACAFEAFRRERVDAAVVEVGLGGRLDATNAIDPLVSVVVTVDFDHVGQLGSTLAAIAGEKADIARRGRPLVTGIEAREPLEVLRRRCLEVGAHLVEARHLTGIEPRADGTFDVVTERARYDRLRLALAGDHQRDNARVALVALERFTAAAGVDLKVEAVRLGLASTRWPGRLQWLDGEPPLLLDGAHNGAGASTLAAFLDRRPGARPVLLFAAMRDKDLDAVLRPLAERASFVVATRPGVSRAADPIDLAAAASRWTSSVEARPDTAEALARARALALEAGPEGYVLVAGSLYLVGEVLRIVEDAAAPGPVPM